MSEDGRRSAGLERLKEVYGDELGFSEMLQHLTPEQQPYTEVTIDTLFADVWSRPGLSVRDRRLLTLGVTAARGRADLLETQLVGALKAGELTHEQLGEVVLHLAYYAGWPNGQATQRAATAAVRRVEEEG